jgi:hypothetical protein
VAIEWYVKTSDKQVGPLSSAQLKELADRKQITATTLVRRGDQAQWIQAGTIRDLFNPSPATLSSASTPAPNQVQVSDPSPVSRNLRSPVVFWSLVGGGAFGGLSLIVFGGLWLFGGKSMSPPLAVKPAAAAARTPLANGADDKPAADGVAAKQPPAAEITPAEPPIAKPDPKLSAAYRKVLLLNQHGLEELAKAELIDIVMGKAAAQEKAKALYLLGSIAFGERRIGAALSTWRDLVAEYPDSPEAIDVKDRIAQLAEMVGENAKESTDNAVAESYLRHANFWSEGRDTIFSIDTSWIPQVESAVRWYDKVIHEFPKSTASRIAHEQRLFTLLGWKDRRYDSIRFGLEASFDKYMPIVQEALLALEQEHPNASAIQAFRFQIAQAYWAKNDKDNATLWLNKILAAAGDRDTFYSHLAKERLAHLNRE